METNSPTASVTERQTTPQRAPWRELLDNRWLMIATLFLVTAALGLPFLWMSRAFSTTGKVLLTIAVLLWTAVVLWVFYLIMDWALGRIWESLQTLSG